MLTGGLGGVMEAACRGARSSAKYQAGDTVGIVPGHDPRDANAFVDVVLASGLDHVRNSVVAHADAVIAIGGGAGTMSEICFAWIYKRLIIGMRVEGWSGRMADQRVDERIRYPSEPDDRVFGADSADEVLRTLVDRLAHFSDHHRCVRRRD
ncbi:MAG: acyl-CoA synthetase [Phycisphaerae bacterium]|nr:acyl-CoA synthetase [Phycisphaerae bacterium]